MTVKDFKDELKNGGQFIQTKYKLNLLQYSVKLSKGFIEGNRDIVKS